MTPPTNNTSLLNLNDLNIGKQIFFPLIKIKQNKDLFDQHTKEIVGPTIKKKPFQKLKKQKSQNFITHNWRFEKLIDVHSLTLKPQLLQTLFFPLQGETP